MRFKLFILWEAVFLGLTTLVILPAFRPAAGRAELPGTQANSATPTALASSDLISSPKPLKVWEGVSSWYGEDFDGQPTANGETYDMYAATAAHPTLPLGSVVRVVNLRNHRSQVVRINDRGPYVEGRELDVSYGVAQKLGFEHRGLDRVRIELLEVPSRPVNPDQN
jgi:rare lipoprotein A (peptidoglycan hydrolase)